MLVLRKDIASHPAASKLLDAVHRSLARPRKRKMLEALVRSMGPVSIRTPAGLYLGQAPGYHVDLERLGRVTNRIVRGLFFKTFGRILPTTHGVRSFVESGLRDLPPDLDSVVRQTVMVLASTPLHQIGDDVFEYRYQVTSVDPNTTAWLFRFYNVEAFLVVTAPRGDRSSQERKRAAE